MKKLKNISFPDDELAIIEDVLADAAQSGMSLSSLWVANFLVALKSKPMIILTGAPDAKKESLVKTFGNILTGESNRYQPMTGHPWWANQMENLATYTDSQSRFNTFKLESMLEEAGLPEHRDKYYIAALIKISPGELQEYFSETAFQLQHGQIMRLPAFHYSNPIPFPSNLSIIGTMDTEIFDWFDRDLLSQATILHCGSEITSARQSIKKVSSDHGREKSLIRSSIRDPQKAFRKVFKMARGLSSAFLPFIQISKLLQKAIGNSSSDLLKEGIIYLANSWSEMGMGLFASDPKENFQIASDLAITQSLLLPNSTIISQSEGVQKKLNQILGNRFPHASAYINQLALS